MYRIEFSPEIRANNPDMKERFREVEGMEFESIKKVEYFLTTTFGSTFLDNKNYCEIFEVK